VDAALGAGQPEDAALLGRAGRGRTS
jgi:hypothetical protein